MALFILSPPAIPLAEKGAPVVPVPALEVTDHRDHYSTSEGDGLWILPFLEFLEEKVRERAHSSRFQFSDTEGFDDEVLAEAEPAHVRALLIEFTNTHYRRWRDRDVACPDYDSVRDNCRSYCDECDSGWDEVHGEYDGPRAEDVAPDEDWAEPAITDAERAARRERNRERERERARRREAREEAESEVVDKDFTCEDDCDGFMDRINDAYREEFCANTDALEARWEEFLEERGEQDFPPLHL